MLRLARHRRALLLLPPTLPPLAAAAGLRAASSPPAALGEARVEVERKFACPPEVEARVARAAARCERRRLLDVYYDAPPAYPLSAADTWLRRRNGAWELKVPAASGGGVVDRYREVEEPGAIAAALGLRLPLPAGAGAGADALEHALAAAGYAPFARIHTDRRSYTLLWPLPAETAAVAPAAPAPEAAAAGAAADVAAAAEVHVDVDDVTYEPPTTSASASSATGGAGAAGAPPPYRLGEVEVLLPPGASGCRLGAGEAAVGAVMAALGLPDGTVLGKVLEAVRRRGGDHWRAVVGAGLVATKLGRPHAVPGAAAAAAGHGASGGGGGGAVDASSAALEERATGVAATTAPAAAAAAAAAGGAPAPRHGRR
jgi:hypothetical protein